MPIGITSRSPTRDITMAQPHAKVGTVEARWIACAPQ